jgi:hypothetical protein
MARLDRRLLPLIETLAASGADWLAFELTDGIRSGRVVEEQPEALERARTLVREGSFGSIPVLEHDPEISPHIEPIAGDEQIDWAIQFVSTRLENTVAMLASALEGLDDIVKESSRTEAPVGTEMMASEVTLVLQIDEAFLQVERLGAMAALNAVQALRSALSTWGATVLGGGQL